MQVGEDIKAAFDATLNEAAAVHELMSREVAAMESIWGEATAQAAELDAKIAAIEATVREERTKLDSFFSVYRFPDHPGSGKELVMLAEPVVRRDALESAAGEANRALDQRTASLRDQWKDAARREFDAEYVGPVVDGGRHLRTELNSIAAIAERVTRELEIR